MQTIWLNKILLVILTTTTLVWSYTNLTPAEVHSRIVLGDTLLLLDVREVSEYKAGHIAEPQGQLPLTPINLPLNSGVLAIEYHRLPANIDIIVYCRSGGRSATASSFLESKGFTHVFNMTGGFSSWTYESRTNGFGNHSGQWIRTSDLDPVTITCSAAVDTSKIIFPPNALPDIDSIYLELNFASTEILIPPNVPQSDLEGMFRVTALDRFAIPLFMGDSLALSDTVYINLFPKYQGDEIINPNMTIYIPGGGWRNVSFSSDALSIHRNEIILRRWYNVAGFLTDIDNFTYAIPFKFTLNQNYPNPFNPRTVISWYAGATPMSPVHVELSVYNILGQNVATLISGKQKAGFYTVEWDAQGMASGVYFYRLRAGNDFVETKKMFLLR